MKTLAELQSLEGQVAIVTGGAGYLGKAITQTIAELGATVIILSRTEKKCQDWAEQLKADYGIKSEGLGLDITNYEQIENVFKHIYERYGRIDILVNNAWSGNKNNLDSIDVDDWTYDVNVCLNAVFYCCKLVKEYLIKTEGRIVNIASMYGHVAPDYRLYDGKTLANPPSYGAAKAGVIQLTKYLASFLSEYKVRVNSISPGPFPFPETGEQFPEFIQKLSEKNMMNRIGLPDDLKGVTALLCTNASNYITGQNFCVDGGWAVW